MNEEKRVLTKEEALAMLPFKKDIHIYRNPKTDILMGFDIDRKTIIEKINKHKVEATGEQAQEMGHGMALYDEYGWMFIETVTAYD